MSVNLLNKEQCYQLLASIHDQATGTTAITPTDLSSFISVANSTLAVGTDKVMGAISNVLQRTIIAVRPYDEKFKGLEYTADEWGGIIRKLSFADRAPEQDESYALVDGQSIDPFKVRKPNVLETRYYGSDIYTSWYTVPEKQLKECFANPGNFNSFISGLMVHFSNERKQHMENLKRTLLANAIAGKNAMAQDVINLRSAYNTATGLTLTAQQLLQPANFKPFMEWAYKEVAKVSRLMEARSEKYQMVITGKPIMRHTDKRDQRVYFIADFLEAMTAQVLADTYHDNFLKYADVEAVDFWQAIDNPMEVKATPVYVDATGAVKTGTAQAMTNVIGVMFDRDAMGYNIIDDSLTTSPYNQAGQYYNLQHHADIQLQEDFTEKIVVFTLN